MKVMSILKISDAVNKLRNPVIVHCHGCFDFLHIGHMRHLQAAKEMGDKLVVTVTSDRFVNKGEFRPIFKDVERMEMISALSFVDYVAINDAATPLPAIHVLKPNLYVKGQDYADIEGIEFEAVRSYGGKVVFTDTIKYSTTQLVERIRKC